ncbi:MAG: TetR family transcriptional regulator [Thermoplasmata archaeon]
MVRPRPPARGRQIPRDSPHSRLGRRKITQGSARDDILRAAQRLFLSQGLDHTSGRAIAREARVDPALVLYYFRSKEDLFLETLGSIIRPQMERVAPHGSLRPGVGADIVRGFLGLWDAEDRSRILVALLRSAGPGTRMSEMLQNFLLDQVQQMLSAYVPKNELRGRAGLVVTQNLGLAVARYLLRIEPVASASSESLAATIGPTLDKYLNDPIFL